MARYRKKPIVINAIQYIGENHREIGAFIGAAKVPPVEGMTLCIRSLEGIMQVPVNNWVIKGVKGEFYSCAPDVFDLTYEAVSDDV